VTIGIPVFNGAATLRRAVQSALAQTHRGAVVHVSDNASTDATPQIGRELAATHPKVRFTHHDTGLGISGNFEFLLRQAKTDYFMWLAADDYIAPSYVERTLEALDADPALVACTTRGIFVHPDGTEQPVSGTYPLLADSVANLAAYLSAPHDNTRIFGLYRTRALKAAFPPRYFHAYDWAIAAGTLLHGKHMEVAETLIMRDPTPVDSYKAAVWRDNPTAVGRAFPVLPMTTDLVFRQRIPLQWPVIKALVRLNLEMHAYHVGYYYPLYNKTVTRFLRRYVLWRLTTPPLPVHPGEPTPATAALGSDAPKPPM
jgi:glycosyltransferase involved in cell wall biosynthesis